MAADNTLTFTNISLTSENMDETVFTVSAWGVTAIKLTGISQEAWNPGPGGGGGGSSRPSTGFLYPRGLG